MSGARERVSHDFSAQNQAFEIGPLSSFSSLVTIKAPKWIYGAHAVETNLALLSAIVRAPIEHHALEIWYMPFDYAVAVEIFQEHLSTAAIFKQTLGVQLVNAHVLDLTNRINYRQSAVMLRCCDIYIGNDTGTMHLAAAVSTPVLMPSCFAADLDVKFSVLDIYHPYRVPSVTVLVKNALPECKALNNGVGCVIYNRRHCIAQIAVDKMFEGYRRLKERIAEKNIEPLFIS